MTNLIMGDTFFRLKVNENMTDGFMFEVTELKVTKVSDSVRGKYTGTDATDRNYFLSDNSFSTVDNLNEHYLRRPFGSNLFVRNFTELDKVLQATWDILKKYASECCLVLEKEIKLLNSPIEAFLEHHKKKCSKATNMLTQLFERENPEGLKCGFRMNYSYLHNQVFEFNISAVRFTYLSDSELNRVISEDDYAGASYADYENSIGNKNLDILRYDMHEESSNYMDETDDVAIHNKELLSVNSFGRITLFEVRSFVELEEGFSKESVEKAGLLLLQEATDPIRKVKTFYNQYLSILETPFSQGFVQYYYYD